MTQATEAAIREYADRLATTLLKTTTWRGKVRIPKPLFLAIGVRMTENNALRLVAVELITRHPKLGRLPRAKKPLQMAASLLFRLELPLIASYLAAVLFCGLQWHQLHAFGKALGMTNAALLTASVLQYLGLIIKFADGPSPARWSPFYKALMPQDEVDALLGDLEEGHRLRAARSSRTDANQWLRIQLLRSLPPLLCHALRRWARAALGKIAG